jgi:hypothetical protein
MYHFSHSRRLWLNSCGERGWTLLKKEPILIVREQHQEPGAYCRKFCGIFREKEVSKKVFVRLWRLNTDILEEVSETLSMDYYNVVKARYGGTERDPSGGWFKKTFQVMTVSCCCA